MLAIQIESELREFELAVELAVEPGNTLALVGPSGAGKSTVMRAVAGLHRPDRGRIDLGSETWLDTDSRIDLAPDARSCGYLFQAYALFPHLSVWRNVAFALRDLPRSERRARSEALLDSFGIRGLADAAPGRLSGGERQRVALARALARRPAVLLLDEPLAALDSTTAAAASRELAATLANAAVPTVLVTHDFGEAALLADEIAVIDRGRIVQRGTAAELSAKPASAFVADFTGATVLAGLARAGDGGMTVVELDGGGRVISSDLITGPVGIAVFPWEITLEPAGSAPRGSAVNRLPVQVASVTDVGNRSRVGLRCPQPLVAEVMSATVERMGLAPGTEAIATFKATATRLIER
jgi:molybdate transport system ATP-binding protein